MNTDIIIPTAAKPQTPITCEVVKDVWKQIIVLETTKHLQVRQAVESSVSASVAPWPVPIGFPAAGHSILVGRLAQGDGVDDIRKWTGAEGSRDSGECERRAGGLYEQKAESDHGKGESG